MTGELTAGVELQASQRQPLFHRRRRNERKSQFSSSLKPASGASATPSTPTPPPAKTWLTSASRLPARLIERRKSAPNPIKRLSDGGDWAGFGDPADRKLAEPRS